MSLQGTLSTLGIAELLELLAKRDASGQLDVTTKQGSASYLLADGTVSLCEFEFARGMGDDAAEATYYIIAEDEGQFNYQPQDVEGAPDGMTVRAILDQTDDVSNRWDQVEEKIPSVSHILLRNSELDGSVTIEPEWWKVLEAIGTGKSSSELAQSTDAGVLDASTVLLEMVEAGLIVVSDQATPVEVPAPVAEEPAAAEEVAPVAEEAPAPEEAPAGEEMYVADELPPVEEMPAVDEMYAAEEVTVPAPVPVPTAELVPESDVAQIEVASEEQPLENPMSFMDQPAVDEATDVAPAPPIMAVPELAIEPEPVTEPEPVIDAAPVDYVQPAEFAPLESTADLEAEADAAPTFGAGDQGWSENPFVAPVSDAVEAQPFFEEVATPIIQESAPVEQISEIPSFEQAAPILEPVAEIETDFNSETSDLYGLDSTFHDAPVEAAPAPSVADEVMGDLSYLNDDLDNQLADTPVAPMQTFEAPQQEAVAPAQASPAASGQMPSPIPQLGEQDPFGSLSDLVVDDEEDDDRSSVLKFLRRD